AAAHRGSDRLAVVLREGPQKLTAGDGRVGQRADGDQSKERIGRLLLQGRAQLEELIGKLVDLLVRSGEMAALGTGVRNVKGNAAGELALHVEIPLLRISGGIVRKGRREALTEEKLLETRSVARRLNNSGRERITQAVERRDRTVIGSDEGCGV